VISHTVTIDGAAACFPCREDTNVLAAMERTLCRAIPVGCRNGGCGACKVRVTRGAYETRKMNRAVVSLEEEQQGCVLACRTYPRGDLQLQVLGRAWPGARPASTTPFGFGFARTAPTSPPDQET
jgi:ferredoxin